MKRHRSLLVSCIILGLLVGSALAYAGDSNEKDAKWAPLVESVKNILLGKTSDQPGIDVADGAQLVTKGSIVSLADVIAGKSKNCSLVEKSEKSPVSVQLKMNNAEDAAYIILGTHPEGQKGQRVHTVLFMKDANGKWLIENWHTSN